MKKIIVLPVLILCFSYINLLEAGDDVYDAPKQREVKVKQTYSDPKDQSVEQSIPYNEDENTNSRSQSPSYNNNQNDYQYDNNYSGNEWNYSFSDRIRRFHNPSIRYSYGWSNCNNTWYDPWNSYNSFGTYNFTPSWVYSYNDYFNPFCGGTQIIIINDPWMNSWYNTGYYNPYNNWYSPSCASIIYNNGYPYNGGYYHDGGRKNVVNTPRTGGYNNNTNNGTSGNNYF